MDGTHFAYVPCLNSFGEAGDAKTGGSDSALLPFPIEIPGLCGKGVTVLSGGAHHSAAVTADGQCLVWGRLDGGQLQDETLVRRHGRNKPAYLPPPNRRPECWQRPPRRLRYRPQPSSLTGRAMHTPLASARTASSASGLMTTWMLPSALEERGSKTSS